MVKYSKILGVWASTTLFALTACTQTSPHISADPAATAFGTITVSSGTTDETDIVAHLYALALEEAGYTVEIVNNGSTRSDYLSAMGATPVNTFASVSPLDRVRSAPARSDTETVNNPETVDITPDYSGNLLLHLTDDGALSPSDIEAAKERLTSSPAPSETSASEISSALPTPSKSATGNPLNVRGMSGGDIITSLEKVMPLGLKLLDASSAENKDTLVVTRATAEKYGLETMSDLAKHCQDLAFGAPQAFEKRSYGLPGLEEVYGCTPKSFTGINHQVELADSLAQDTVQVANIFTSSAEIEDNAFVVLEDNANNFIAQQIVPVVRADELPQSAQDAINTVSATLTTEDLVQLNRLTTGDNSITHKDAAMFWFTRISE